MSGIVGIVNRDGAPCDRELVGAMVRAIAFRGPAGVSVAGDGPACFATLHSRPLRATKPSEVINGRRRLTIAFDGRIDNRTEIERRVGARAGALSDPDLILALHSRDGDDAFARIVGDFAIAIWEHDTRTLTCVRDTWGVRPFVYCEIGPMFAFASEVAALRVLPGFDSRPDETMVAEHLAIDIRSGDRTLYRSVRRLEPAHSLLMREDATIVRRYWSYDATRVLRLDHDEDYAGTFLEQFRSAVLARVDPAASTGCELSGGIDSSSVTVVAHRFADRPIVAYSLVFPGLACDESDFIEQVVAAAGLPAHRVTPGVRRLDELMEEAIGLADAPDLANGAMHRAVYDRASAHGVALLLTGLGGDDWFQGSNNVRRIGELLYEGHAAEALNVGTPQEMGAALRLLVAQSPAGPTLRTIRRFVCGEATGAARPPWITRDLWERSGAGAVLAAEAEPVRGSPARIETLRTGSSAWAVWGAERAERVAARYGVELRHPFLDRRVRELGLALPECQRLRHGLTRYVVRNAMRELLPDEVRLRRSKAFFSPVFLAELRTPGVAELLKDLSIASRGWVEGAWLRERHQSLSSRPDVSSADDLTAMWAIAMTVSLEAWHRGLSS